MNAEADRSALQAELTNQQQAASQAIAEKTKELAKLKDSLDEVMIAKPCEFAKLHCRKIEFWLLEHWGHSNSDPE